MPHLPDSQHDTHDLELVAAFAADDATGADLATASALVASCPDCAEVHADIRAIIGAVAAAPAPVRTRDFRISAEQAASLRPTGWRALLATLASPRLSFAAPLGTGLAALGIVGVLVAGGGATAGGSPEVAPYAAAGDQAATVVEPSPEIRAMSAASAAPVASSVDPDVALKSSPAPGGIAGGEAAGSGPAATGATDPGSEAAMPVAGGPSPVQLVGSLLAVIGIALVGLRIVARRYARAL